MIRARGLVVTLGGRRILDGVDLDVEKGESVALVGPNGAGKTTVLRCVLGLVRHEGTIEIGGIDAARDPVGARRLVGYMPQVPAFCEDKARGALAFAAALRGSPKDDIDRLLALVGLTAHADRDVRSFSTGMRQRLSLAAALLGDPPVLVLDEATASLDLAGQAEVVALLAKLHAGGTTILMSSHRAEELRALAGRAVMLDEGRVVDAPPPPATRGAPPGGAARALRVVAGGGRR
ncbi:MAG: ABC transporter ATP-binding protein [Polyangiaceae bacterium]|nr:ABC transporter ATP-binding protein [Polyangiaceae bacterium]